MTKKKYDPDIIGWYYKNGHRIPIREKNKQPKESKIKYREIQSGIDRVKSDKYTEGTYDVKTLQTKSFNHGYQVSYCQIGDKYTEDEHNNLIAEFARSSSDGEVYIGKFEGNPEHSFHVESKREAVRLAKKYNQKSVWDWKQNSYALGM